jgi:DNA polymerase-3 subunit alpha
MSNFCHLHAHTEISPDGLGTTEALVKRAVELKMTHLAMTDHGSLGNAVNFWSICTDNGITPILGLEAYLGWNGKRHHGTIISTSKNGFSNLVKLSNAAHQNYTSGFPLMTLDILESHNLSDLTMLTGCPASPIHEGDYASALIWAGTMYELFGGRLVAEVMCVVDEDFITRPMKIAKQLGIQTVLTNDVHYPLSTQRNAHKILTECRKGFSYDSDRLWLKSESEMESTALRFFDSSAIKSMMQTSLDLAALVSPWSMESKPQLPTEQVAELIPDFEEKLKNGLESDLVGRPHSECELRQARFDMEMRVLRDAGFIEYFVVLEDIIAWSKANDIVVGPGRGSGAASYVLYLLGVTGIDPIDHGLIFERFLNESRKEYPDVDIDVEGERRNEVLDYASERWGGVQIATYAHYGHKVTVADINRVLRTDFKIAEAAAEEGIDGPNFPKWVSMHSDILPTYEAMMGQIRHAGKHAGGVVITDQDIPIEMISGKLVAAWTEGQERWLSRVGVVKYDILGLTALSQLKRMRQIVGREGIKYPKDGDPIFSLFQNGDVLGIFQWTGSDGIRSMTKRINPNRFIDLVVINALYRPGALDAGTAELYPKLADNPRKLEPRIDEVLLPTRGIIVFQEQMMGVFAAVMGISFGESDMIRRLIIKPKPEDPKWVAAIDRTKANFLDAGIKRGFDPKLLQKLWGEIMTHTRYSFVKAHSASYTAVACEMAWFKYYHPLVFYSVCMECDSANIQAFMIEASLKGIKLITPHINRPNTEFTFDTKTNSIFLPLGIVKHFSSEKAEQIKKEYYTNGPFHSIKDFRSRLGRGSVNARASKNLWMLGAFDGLPGESSEIFETDEDLPTGAIAQVEALGFALPSLKVAAYFAQYGNDENIAVGYVKDWKDKQNKRGKKYRVYKLVPSGTFWIDDEAGMNGIKKGDLVKVRKNRYGKAFDRVRLKI